MEKRSLCGTDTEQDLDDIIRDSDFESFRNTSNYSFVQRDLENVITSIKKLIDLPEYHDHIRGEACMQKLKNIDKQLDFTIVVADIRISSPRVFRTKYADKLRISTCDSEDRQIQVTGCDDREDMADKLSGLASTKDAKIKYIDVWIPVEILKDNIVILDIQGIEDQDQEEVAELIKDYLPNTLAFVFVVNGENAGEQHGGRLVQRLKNVKKSFIEKYGFDPKDPIFLLNKWDTLPRQNLKGGIFVETRLKLHDICEGIDEHHVLEFVASRFSDNKVDHRQIDRFKVLLGNMIANKKVRRKTHLEFVKSFIECCEVVLIKKVNFGRQSVEENVQLCNQFSKELHDAEYKRQEAHKNLQQNVDEFLEEAAKTFHDYIHSTEFKRRILQGMDEYSRIRIGSEIGSRIEKETYRWQQMNIEKMFEATVMKKLTENMVKIQESLHRLNYKLRGLTSPFDVENKLPFALVSFFAPSAPAVAGSILMTHLSVNRNAAIALAATGLMTGLVYSGLVMLDAMDDNETAIKNAYKARVERLTTEKIKQSLTKAYAEGLENIVKNFLEGDFKDEIDNLKRTVTSTRKKIDYFQKETSKLAFLCSAMSKIRIDFSKINNA
ncbi:uncharacterized protein LOC125661888 isoform X2 [Ostrea edulis]|uniref:uncharacterized protein LOC125661888 isoform X2 n=1 Tax=Ostrea edulis TaxID=37623 RepID=UPI0024AEFAC5|nr:uncharacterized protein LOC125661888 isoform X2 [Ostrea edulis]